MQAGSTSTQALPARSSHPVGGQILSCTLRAVTHSAHRSLFWVGFVIFTDLDSHSLCVFFLLLVALDFALMSGSDSFFKYHFAQPPLSCSRCMTNSLVTSVWAQGYVFCPVQPIIEIFLPTKLSMLLPGETTCRGRGGNYHCWHWWKACTHSIIVFYIRRENKTWF